MPYRSRAQQRFMHAVHPELAPEFDAATKDFKDLPEKVKKPKAKKRISKKK